MTMASGSSLGIIGRAPAPRGHYLRPLEGAHFWSLVHEGSDGCWRWKGEKGDDGRGRIWVREVSCDVALVAWFEAGRELKAGYELVPGCGHDWCINPDHQNVVSSRPLRGHYLTPEEGERFWAKVDERANENGCWRWTGAAFQTGKGEAWVRGKPVLAMRVAWLEAGRELRPREPLLPTCGFHWCMHPDHQQRHELKPKVEEPKKKRVRRTHAPIEKPAAEATGSEAAEEGREIVELALRPMDRARELLSLPEVVEEETVPSRFTDAERLALLAEPVTVHVSTATWAIVYTRDHDIVGYGVDLYRACDNALEKRAARWRERESSDGRGDE